MLQTSALIASSPAALGDLDLKPWIRSNAIDLQRLGSAEPVDAGRTFDLPISREARLLAFGEEVHGVGTLIEIKSRIFRWLVANRGFDTFILEDDLAGCMAIDDFIQGRGEAKSPPISGLYWCWNNQDIADLVLWMREFNAQRPQASRPLRFFGIDMQSSATASAWLGRYLAGHEPESWSQHEEVLVAIRDKGWTLAELPAEEFGLITGALAELERILGATPVKQPDSAALAERSIARRLVRTLQQHAEFQVAMKAPDAVSFGLRDRFMAENARWVLKQQGPESRVAICTANAHAALKNYAVNWQGTTGTVSSMGSFLRAELGANYLAIGLFRNQGEYLPDPRSGATGVAQIGAAAQGTINAGLASAGIERYWLPIAAAATGSPAAKWLNTEHPQIFYEPIAPAVQFDHLIFADHTRAPRARE